MIEHAATTVSDQLKDDIKFAYDRVTKFAEAQKASISDFETELSPGLWAGQKSIPIETAGCYVPGGRYAHVASAIMSIATAKVAGVENVIACSAPNGKDGPASGNLICDEYVRGGYDSIAGRCAGYRGDGIWPVYRQACPASGRPGQPLCGRGETYALWPRWY
jgi:hypothetical protein